MTLDKLSAVHEIVAINEKQIKENLKFTSIQDGVGLKNNTQRTNKKVTSSLLVPHRDFGGGVNERADAGWCIGLIHVGAEHAHTLVLTRLNTGIQVVGVQLVNPEIQVFETPVGHVSQVVKIMGRQSKGGLELIYKP